MGKMGYTTILGWMYALDLKLAETVCLAVIFGFSQDGESTFIGSRKYLAKRMCVKDRKTVDAALSKLCGLDLIEKMPVERNGVKSPEYRVTPHCLELAVSLGYGNNPQDGKIPDNDVEKSDSYPVEKTDITYNSNRPNGIKQHSDSFDLADALINILGVSKQTAIDWVAIRSKAGMHETVTAYKAIAEEVRKFCEQHGVSADDCIKYAVLRGWKTIVAEYDCPGLKKNESQKEKMETIKF